MDLSLLAPGTQEVLTDLLAERGLTKWQVLPDVRISVDSNENVDIIYGCALTASLQEERLDRKRKRKTGTSTGDKEQPTWSCFLVLPAVSSSQGAPTLSIKRLVELQQCADTNEPSTSFSTATKRAFLCLTDAGNISYYALQAPAILP